MHEVDANHEHRADRRVGGDPPGPGGQGRGERSTGASDIEGACVHGAELVLKHHRGRRRDVVRRIGAEDDQVHVLGPQACPFEGLLGGGQSHVRGGPVLGSVPTAANSRGGLHLVHELGKVREPLTQVIVVHTDLGKVTTRRSDRRESVHSGSHILQRTLICSGTMFVEEKPVSGLFSSTETPGGATPVSSTTSTSGTPSAT